MEWDNFVDSALEDAAASSHYDAAPPPPPYSFFDPKIEALNSTPLFPKQFFDDLSGCRSTIAADSEFEEQLRDDLSDLIGNDFGDNLLKSEDLSVLSTDEIFSQIDAAVVTTPAAASDLYDDGGGAVVGHQVDLCGGGQPCDSVQVKQEGWQNNQMVCQITSQETYPMSFSDSKDLLSIAVTSNDVAGFAGDQPVQGGSSDQAAHQLNHQTSLEKVELDILKLEQEVDINSNSDEDSLWSDFFSEEDASEISPEYDNLLKSLLTTPVDDIDVSLNVFNSLDEYSSEDESNSTESSDVNSNSQLLEQVLADHCYTLPWGEHNPHTMTPPNSGDDSDPESQVYSSPRRTDHSEIPPKFLTTRTVKLKHKKDLKFVFSFKVKDEEEEEDVKYPLPESNPTPPASPPSFSSYNFPQHKRPMYKGVSVLKRNQLLKSSNLQRVHNRSHQYLKAPLRHQPTASSIANALPFKRAYSKLHGESVGGGRSAAACSREADLAVKSILMPGSVGHEQYRSEVKVQTDRELHNSMERQRRIQLKNELDTLKDKIPDLRGNEKVSKLNVLNVAAGYVKKLEKVETKLRQRKHHLREEKSKLIQRLSQLNQLGNLSYPGQSSRLNYPSA